MNVINSTLSPRLRELGFELFEDEDFVTLKWGHKVARFSAKGFKPEEAHKEAEKWLKEKPATE